MKEKAFMGYTIKGIDEYRIPRRYNSSKSNTVYLLLEAVEADDFCVTPEVNSVLKGIWIEYFNQSIPGWSKQFKNAPEQSAHPLSEIEYYEHEDYKALKIYDTNCPAIGYWGEGLQHFMSQTNGVISEEITNLKNFKVAAEEVNSRCFSES